MRKLWLSLIMVVPVIALLGLQHPVKASDFNVAIDRQFVVDSQGGMTVTETHTVKNNSGNLLISKTNQEVFQLPVITSEESKLQKSLVSAKVTVDGTNQSFTTTMQTSYAEISVPYPRELHRGETMVFTVVYTNYGLVEKKGALVDIYAPGFAKGFNFTKGLTTVSYTTTVSVDTTLPPLNFVIPAAQTTEKRTIAGKSYDAYLFSQDSLVGATIWIQRGTTQYYQFKITEDAPATDDHNTGYSNEYRLIIPRAIDEGEISQQVYFTSITPKPFQVLQDSDGNLIGYFKVPSHQETTISIEGFAQVSTNGVVTGINNGGTIMQVPTAMIPAYTAAAQYWEVDAPQVQTLAAQLKGTNQNLYQVVSDTYQHIVNTIDYSEVKRFGLNVRQGALKTLNGGAAVCMEYSDLFLTLSRAEGIPARAAFGYGYDSRLPSDAQEAHQWVEVYAPGLGKWISVDVTWGESGPALIGGDLNHFFTHVASKNPDTPAMVERVSYGKNTDLAAPKFAISVISSLPPTADTLTEQQLLTNYPEVQQSSIQTVLENFLNSISADFQSDNLRQNANLFIAGGIVLIVVSSGIIITVMVRSARKRK